MLGSQLRITDEAFFLPVLITHDKELTFQPHTSIVSRSRGQPTSAWLADTCKHASPAPKSAYVELNLLIPICCMGVTNELKMLAFRRLCSALRVSQSMQMGGMVKNISLGAYPQIQTLTLGWNC